MICPHTPACPSADDPNCASAHEVNSHDDEQGWTLLCNGVLLMHDRSAIRPNGEVVMPDGTIVPSHYAPRLVGSAA